MKFLKIAIPALVLALAIPAAAIDGTTVLSAVATATTSSVYDTSNSTDIRVHVFSASGSTSTVLLETAEKAAGPWFVVATITDASATGEHWSIPRTSWFRVRASAVTAGNVSAVLSVWRDDKRIY